MIAALSAAFAVSGVVTKLIADDLSTSFIEVISLAFLFPSMLCFFVGAMIGFNGLRPKPITGVGAGYLRIISQGGDESRQLMRMVASHYQVTNRIQTNFISAAADLIRIGIITFAIGITIDISLDVASNINIDDRGGSTFATDMDGSVESLEHGDEDPPP